MNGPVTTPTAASAIRYTATAPVVLGWTGRTDDPVGQSLYEYCSRYADAVVRRDEPADWVRRPATLALTHGLIWQPNRHSGKFAAEPTLLRRPKRSAVPKPHLTDPSRQSVTTDGHDTESVQTAAEPTRWLVVRGPGVSSKPNLPGDPHWLESVEWCEVPWMLADWLRPFAPASDVVASSDCSSGPATAVVISDSFSRAEPLLETLPTLPGGPTTAIWQSWPSPIACNGKVLFVWDDSVARPTDRPGWNQRLQAAEQSLAPFTPMPSANKIGTAFDVRSGGARVNWTHLWLTSAVTPAQWQSATAAGVAAILPKPFRLQSLRNAIASRPAFRLATPAFCFA